MRKAQVAEWILSLFVAPELAASTVGDWMEEVPALGTRWFWLSLCRTAGSFIWRDLSAEPLFTAGLALRAWALNIGFILGCFLSIALAAAVFGLFIGIFASAGAFAGGIPDWLTKPQWTATWIAGFSGLIATLAVEFQIGKWIARRARGREIAACIAYGMTSLLCGLILGAILQPLAALSIVSPRGVAASNTFPVANLYLSNVLLTAATWAGAIWVRRETTRAKPV